MKQSSIEAQAFSQYNEDGIIEYLLACIVPHERTNTFVDIGAGNGKKRSNTWRLAKQHYGGVLYEANTRRFDDMVDIYTDAFGSKNVAPIGRNTPRVTNAEALSRGAFIPVNVSVQSKEIEASGLYPLPDKTSVDLMDVDIDSEDWFVARALLRRGMRPKVWIVEYNPNFGSELSLACSVNCLIPAKPKSKYRNLFYGASLHAWRRLMRRYRYRFVCVESHGSNAFFIYEPHADMARVNAVEWLDFADNAGWRMQFGTIGERLRTMRDLGFEAEKVGRNCA